MPQHGTCCHSSAPAGKAPQRSACSQAASFLNVSPAKSQSMGSDDVIIPERDPTLTCRLLRLSFRRTMRDLILAHQRVSLHFVLPGMRARQQAAARSALQLACAHTSDLHLRFSSGEILQPPTCQHTAADLVSGAASATPSILTAITSVEIQVGCRDKSCSRALDKFEHGGATMCRIAHL